MAASLNGLTDEELESQASAMAEKAGCGFSAEKKLAVKQQILQRLRKQRDQRMAASTVPAPPGGPAPPPAPNSHGNPSPPPPPPNGTEFIIIVSGSAATGLNGKYLQQQGEHNGRPYFRHVEDPFVMFYSASKHKWYLSTEFEDAGFSFIDSDAPSPPEGVWSKGATVRIPSGSGLAVQTLQVDGVEVCGDEAWFMDMTLRQRLRDSVAESHKEQKIIVGPPLQEVARICPPDGRTVGAGAVLRLGGAHLGGYGESDIAYAYRQLSRALHPDRNPDVPNAPAAFMRLSTASEELRQALNDQRLVLRQLVAAMGGQATPEMLERPQEAVFAEATRMLTAACGLGGEGWSPNQALTRGAAVFSQSGICYNCNPDAFLTDWFSGTSLLPLFGGSPVRTSYDCAPKRLRALFLCLLNRVLLVEARRSDGCVRAGWTSVLESFPELGIWREFRDRIQQRVWDLEGAQRSTKWDKRDRSRSRSPGREPSPDPQRAIAGHPETGEEAGKWALKWRKALAVVLPSGLDGAVSPLDPDVKKLAKTMWKDVVSWVGEGDRCLGLFMADGNMPQRGLPLDAPVAEWCFIPVTDLLLTVGSGLVGVTVEGVYAANRRGHERQSLAKLYKK